MKFQVKKDKVIRTMELPDEMATVLNAKKIAGKLFQIGVARQKLFVDGVEQSDQTKIQPNWRLVMEELPKKNALKEGEEEVYEFEEEEVYYESENEDTTYESYGSGSDDEISAAASSSSEDHQMPNIYDM
ncbi:hypothetical protein SS50377_28588 [Spironucleus salmonicida]|uniref:Ubiquitin-like domain-containing protein n=1 Tax=Spironucleus salmonicida TaxID=348837 RepID=V6LBG2_9EUKA|nr:hypothetical protein SS50377_28588 [Spironucleus salmonicida]|eukprot:EST41588.1 Hypothetical protein SS50377_18929 [Spironucleus salmonicida]